MPSPGGPEAPTPPPIDFSFSEPAKQEDVSVISDLNDLNDSSLTKHDRDDEYLCWLPDEQSFARYRDPDRQCKYSTNVKSSYVNHMLQTHTYLTKDEAEKIAKGGDSFDIWLRHHPDWDESQCVDSDGNPTCW